MTDALREAAIAEGTMEHDLYERSDPDAPDVIRDRNGEVVLGLCKRCGRAEIELREPRISPLGVVCEPVE